ncbi:YceD family protein [Nitratifractor sp.]
MKIRFAKVGRSPGSFEYREERLSISGTLRKEDLHRVELEGEIDATVQLVCDRCGALFEERLHAPTTLHLSDRIVEGSEDLDTIECVGGEIDIPEILHGEIEAYRADYHYCPRCRASDREVDIEY